ncbi:MAG: hypothetical protein IJ622_03590 [Bacteroidales bacterium]|nr:hypothetical protein [Bacteroidales bacterium]
MNRLRLFTLLLAFLVTAPTLLNAQIIKGEVFLGGNACQVDGDECYGFKKFGVHAGAGALIPITSFMDVGLEVLFNQKGAYKKHAIVSNSTFPYAYNLKLNYAEIPLMIYLTDKDAVSVGIGVSYGRVVGLNELINGEPSNYEGVGIGIGDGQLHWRQNEENMPDISHVLDINELADIVYEEGFPATTHISEVIANSNTYRGNDFNICADLRFRLWEGIHAELRYQYSLRPIRYRMFYEDANLVLANQIRAQYNNTITLRVVYIFNEHRSKANKEGMKQGTN